jgi:hypothetical protein
MNHLERKSMFTFLKQNFRSCGKLEKKNHHSKHLTFSIENWYLKKKFLLLNAPFDSYVSLVGIERHKFLK